MPRFLAQLDEKATFPVKPLCSRWLFHYGMNVAHLREALASLPDDLDVFIVDDGEVFSPTLTPGELTVRQNSEWETSWNSTTGSTFEPRGICSAKESARAGVIPNWHSSHHPLAQVK